MAPRYCRLSVEDGEVSSLRLFGNGWDAVKSKGYHFIQYGKNPVKFVCIMKKGTEPPRFLSGYGFHVVRRVGRIWAGITTRPLQIGKMWRETNGIVPGKPVPRAAR